MEFDHAFHQAGFVPAMQMMVVGSLLAPGIMGRSDLYLIFAGRVASLVVTFGPMGLLGYLLYAVSRLV